MLTLALLIKKAIDIKQISLIPGLDVKPYQMSWPIIYTSTATEHMDVRMVICTYCAAAVTIQDGKQLEDDTRA